MSGINRATCLFQLGEFVGAGGSLLSYKIECDALRAEDWRCIAAVVAPKLGRFSAVYGVPNGGLPFAYALQEYASPDGPVLIADDVWTTGKSMTTFAEKLGVGPSWKGAVAFVRGSLPLPVHVYGFAQINT